MAEKQTILGRITQLAKANINALLDRAEDPKKMLDQLVRDYTNSIAEAEEAVAQTVGNLRLAEKDYESDVAAAKEWGEKAAAAAKKASEAEAAGNSEEASKWNNLAKIAIGKQLEYEQSAKEAEPVLEGQREVVQKLKNGLNQSKAKLDSLKKKRDELVAREKTATAQEKLQNTVTSINVMDPTSELSRWEEQIRRQEAMAEGRAELAADSFESQFEQLADAGTSAEIEARLEALKNKNA